jgi:hypothetical protein
MGIHRGPNPVNDGLVFGCDTGYRIADNSTATRFYPGEPTENFVTTNLETLGTDGSGQSSVGTRTTIAPNHVRIVDVASNTRQTHLISGLTASTIYTVSIQFKKITGTPTFRFQLQGYSGSSYVSTIKFTSTAETGLEDIEGWQTAEWTFTLPSNCNALRIWWQDGADYTTYTHSFELKNPQLEAKSHVTPYVSGTRSSTASLIDLKRTTSIDVSNVSFDSTGQPTFDNSDDRITMPNSSVFNHTSQLTIESWVKFDGNSEDFIFEKGNVNTQYSLFSHGTDIVFRTIHAGDSGYQTLSPSKTTAGITNGVWHHIVGSWDGSTKRIYVDGVDKASVSKSGALTTNSNGAAIGSFGGTSSGYYFGGDIAIVKIYDKGLSADEVKQNYNAYKNRFDI